MNGISLFIQSYLFLREKRTFKFRFNEIEEIGSPNPFQLLRCFGHLISKQEIDTDKLFNVLKYVNEYCCESTTEITLCHQRNLYCMKKPFANVETVSLKWCKMKKKFQILNTTVRLNKLFPNVCKLSVIASNIRRDCIAVHYPKLIQLDFVGHRRERYHVSDTITYTKMLRLNPQLRRLFFFGANTVELVRFASQHLQFLEHLHILVCNFDAFGEEVVNFPCLKELILRVFHSSKKIPFSASCLSEFEFSCAYGCDMDDLLQFLHNHPSITKFKLTGSLKDEQLFPVGIMQALPSAEEIEISALKIPVDDAVRIMEDNQLLRKLCFKVDRTVNLASVKARAGMKYQVRYAGVNGPQRHKLYCLTTIDKL